MYEKGLAYRKKSKVNWCPECATVLANEQVIDGRCWRHEDTIVEQRDLVQWFLRITAYAQELLDGLDKLDGWPEKVRTMQRNWIGRSEGTEVDFCGESTKDTDRTEKDSRIHDAGGYDLWRDQRAAGAGTPAGESAGRRRRGAARAGSKAAGRAEEGARSGRYRRDREARYSDRANSPSIPIAANMVPIWVANYVLSDYGTGAIMSVPGHDERDFEFAKKYAIPVRARDCSG